MKSRLGDYATDQRCRDWIYQINDRDLVNSASSILRKDIRCQANASKEMSSVDVLVRNV